MRLRGRIDGLAGFRTALDEIARAPVTEDVAATAEDVRERAVANLSEGAGRGNQTGALAQSLEINPGSDAGYNVGTLLDQGWHLEFGSRTRPAAPWLAPALDDARPGLLERIRNRLNDTAAAALRRAR
jgi:hypothetical protein